MKYADQFAPQANVIRLKANELTVKGIAQMYMDCPSTADKYSILCKLYGLMNIGSSIIFVKVGSLFLIGSRETQTVLTKF